MYRDCELDTSHTQKVALTPSSLINELPLPCSAKQQVTLSRNELCGILRGLDQRLIIIVGPCSIHDPDAGLDFARRLSVLAKRHARDLSVVMRVYFEKPRTTVGWKGLINDPYLDGSHAVEDGLRMARRFLLDVLDLNLPVATEFLDPIAAQFIADAVSWGAIGARTVESQVHRELASGLAMPIGFKNSTSGSEQSAIEAVRASAQPHHFLAVAADGCTRVVSTNGNPYCHVVLRGGTSGPNFSRDHISRTANALRATGSLARVIVDCSHANSGKCHHRQAHVARELSREIASGEQSIGGLMLESFLVDGRQEHRAGQPLRYGQSITDACLSWEMTVELVETLAWASRSRRAGRASELLEAQ